jgi:hypothetical protein
MKSYAHYLIFNTRLRRERVHMTDEMQQAVEANCPTPPPW